MVAKRFDIYWVRLDPTVGKEIKKTRPAIIISPNEMNDHLDTVLIAPVTSTIKRIKFRPECIINDKHSSILLDHIRSVDKSRLIQKIGALSSKDKIKVLDTLQQMFSL